MTLAELSRDLARCDLGDWFDEDTLERGHEYARAGNVGQPQMVATQGLRHGEYRVQCAVAGSQAAWYACSVRIVMTPDGQMAIMYTNCSCPVGAYCKHAAAMLFWIRDGFTSASHVRRLGPDQPFAERYAAQQHRLELGRWDRWIEELNQPGPRGVSADPRRTFGLLIRRDSKESATLCVLPAWFRPSERRSNQRVLVDPLPLQLDAREGPIPAPATGWPEDCIVSLSTLLAVPESDFGRHWRPIDSVHAERAFERLLEKYPVFYERADRPLARGQELKSELVWRAESDGTQRVKLRVDTHGPEAVYLFGARRLWYVQPDARVFGPVNASPMWLDAIASSPVLRPELYAEVKKRLAASPVTIGAIPPPIDFGAVEDLRVPPAPVLRMHRFSLPLRATSAMEEIGYASSFFDYAGHLIPANERDAVLQRLENGRIYRLHRDQVAEGALLSKLRVSGLVDRDSAAGFTWSRYSARIEHGEWFVLDRQNHGLGLASPRAWKPTIEQLQRSGFRVEYDEDFPHDELVSIDRWDAKASTSDAAWFDVSLGIEIAGERVDLLPILRQLLADPAFPLVPQPNESPAAVWRVKLDESRAIALPLQRLRTMIDPMLEWLSSPPSGKTAKVHCARAAELAAMDLPWRGAKALREQVERMSIREFSSSPAPGFKASLRPYQMVGLAWLNFLSRAGLGGILADDMGLGKTIEVLAHLHSEKHAGRLQRPALVVAPTSLLDNWVREAGRFAPTLKVLKIHGASRADRYAEIPGHGIVVTSYPLLARDRDHLVEQHFSLLVLDEAQAIKNAASQAAKVVREIHADRRLAVTGTPLENHLGELWAQLDAVEPGLLGSARQFTKLFRTPIEKHGDSDRQARLNRRTSLLVLRRTKEQVLQDLPPKTEIVRNVELDGDQRALYESLRLAQHERIQAVVREKGLARSGIIVLDALLKLRQACCDPRLVKLESAHKVKTSVKLEALLDMLDGLLADGRRILVFSQFSEMLALIERELSERGVSYRLLTGDTPAAQRSVIVDEFQSGEVPLFLATLKSGGVGLNLTAADTVIHYDPWWNPAVETQATDRAYRIGQDKPVFDYRLICAGTVEEKIMAMKGRKAALARAVLEGGGVTTAVRFNEADLAELFAPL